MKVRGPYKLLTVLALALSVLSACGKTKYQVSNTEANATADQYLVTKPKVDIIFFQDNSDSVNYGPYSIIKSQMQNFVNNLDHNVDYRFVVLKMLSKQELYEKIVLAKDCNGTQARCYSTSQLGTFNSTNGNETWINIADSNIGSKDYGMSNMTNNISLLNGTGFLRSDASTVVVMLTNGNDHEGSYPETRSDGVVVTKFNYNYISNYVSWFTQFRRAGMLKVFPVVSMYGGNCYGSSSFQGGAYIEFANKMNQARSGSAQAFDLCSGDLSNGVVLNAIFSGLKTMVEAIRFDHVAMDRKPLVSSIKVYKNGQLLSSSNWTYIGYQSNQPTSYYPAPGNNKTGYFVKLNGVDYSGKDQIKVDFTPDWN